MHIRNYMVNWQPNNNDLNTPPSNDNKAQFDAYYGDENVRKRKIWEEKVARYLAWCVDGGLLQSKFTIYKLAKKVASLSDEEKNKNILALEIAFMLHLTIQDKDQFE